MKLNPNITPQLEIGNISPQEDIIIKLKEFFNHHKFDELSVNTITDTEINLLRGLTPTYSPLYANGQVLIGKPNRNNDMTNDQHLKKIHSFLKEKFGDIGTVKNQTTLISQFSGLIIKNLLLGKTSKVFIIDRLFRLNNKDYLQLECGTKGYNIQENIQVMIDILSHIYGKDAKLSFVREKFFYFVSPSFEFGFLIGDRNISLVGGYIDQGLSKQFDNSINKSFIFGVKLEKLLNPKNKKYVNSNSSPYEKQTIVLDESYKDIIDQRKEYLQIDTILDKGKLFIIPHKLTRLDIFRKDVIKNLLENNTPYPIDSSILLKSSETLVTEHNLKIIGNRKREYYENIAYFLEKYYGGEIIENTDNCLEMYFKNFSPVILSDLSIKDIEEGDNAYKIITITQQELLDIFGKNINLVNIHTEKLQYLGYDEVSYQSDQQQYRFRISNHRIDLQTSYDIIGDIFHILGQDILNNNYKNNKLERKSEEWKYTNTVNDFFLIKGYNQLSPTSLSGSSNHIMQNDSWVLSYIFGDPIVYDKDVVITNNTTHILLQNIATTNSSYPKKMFTNTKIPTYLGDCKHIGIAYNMLNEDLSQFNTIFSEIVSLCKKLGKNDNISLYNNDNITFLQRGKSFNISCNGKIIGYMGIVDNKINKKLKGSTILCEFIF